MAVYYYCVEEFGERFPEDAACVHVPDGLGEMTAEWVAVEAARGVYALREQDYDEWPLTFELYESRIDSGPFAVCLVELQMRPEFVVQEQ